MKYIQLPFVARFASSSSSNEKIDRKHGTVRVGFAFCLIVLFLVVKHVACQHRTNLITSKLDIFIGSFGINAKESLCSHELSVVVVVVVFVIDGIICDHLPSHRFDRRNSHVSKHTKRNSSLRPAFSNSRTFFNLPQKDFSIHICFFFWDLCYIDLVWYLDTETVIGSFGINTKEPLQSWIIHSALSSLSSGTVVVICGQSSWPQAWS